MKTEIRNPLLLTLLLAFLLVPSMVQADPGNQYCITPPFITAGLKPNLLLMIDNSASMYDLQYTNSSGTACYDDTYNNASDYIGYFSKLDSSGTVTYPVYKYTYNAATPADSKFEEYADGVPTAGGTYRTSYLYIEMTGTKGASDRRVSSIIASGRFLNWLSASKFDAQKLVLTGGKYNVAKGTLIGESRGCVGRRFVKELPLAAWTFPASPASNPITFAVRGPNAVEPLYNPDTQGGEARIEIYEADFNQTACSVAAENWIGGNYGTAQTQTGNCFDISGSGNTTTGRTLATFNHTMQTCWLLKDNISKGATTEATIWQGVNTNDVTNACGKVYTTDGINPDAITDERDGRYVCTSAITGTAPFQHQTPIAPWNVMGSDRSGFLGKCWKGNANKFDNANNACVRMELLHYCMGQEFTDVIDPSSTATTGGGIPAVLMDAGVRAIGDPIGPGGSAAPSNQFFYAHVAATSPTGLLQKYGTGIRLGAMSLNDIGSASETMPGVNPAGNKDGGKIISFIGDPGVCSVTTATTCSADSACPSGELCNFAGSHSSGLVNALDNIQASTWTPFAEAYYNAIGYFVKDAAASLGASFSASAGAINGPLAGTDSYTNKNPILARCQSNYVLMINDGGSSADQNSTMTGKVTDVSGYFRDPATLAETGATAGVCGIYKGNPYLHDLSYFAKHRNIFNPAVSCLSGACDNAQTINTYAVYTGPATSDLTGVCDPRTQMDLTATNGGTTLYSASNPQQFYSVLNTALSGVLARAASGTAASILSNSEGSGANILQAVFYPKKIFVNNTAVNWIGEMQNLWYFVDPLVQNSTIREDTTSDLKLFLNNDYVVRFAFDSTSDKTMVQRYSDADGDGIVTESDKVGAMIDPDYVKSIWRAGMKLWARSDSSDARTIYTGYNSPRPDGSPQKFSNLPADGYLNTWPGVWNALQIPAGANTAAQREALATKLISYIRGSDQADDTAPCLNANCKYRPRAVTIDVCSSNNQKRCTTSTVATDCPSGDSCTSTTREWKLGDIISSTPRVQSTVRLNTYNLPSPGGYSDQSYLSFINSLEYKERGMVYVGANDGMLHAFRLGKLSVDASGFRKAELTGTNLGSEAWAFIPKNSLPYLKYLTDKDYGHIHYVDGRTVIFDASIGKTTTAPCSTSNYWDCGKNTNGSIPMVDADNHLDPANNVWRTVVIAGMGQGGASIEPTLTACTEGATGDCVKTPVTGSGFSSYFALDVTDPEHPKFLWEFSNNRLGFSTSAPAIVRIGDKDKNGRWFAIFGNGPFGPIDQGTHQFKAESTHHLRFFVVDLATGVLVRTISLDGTGGTPNIDEAFAGTMLGASIDADRRDPTRAGFYKDDAIYSGYVKLGSDSKWTDGGVVRIMTKEDPNPANWVVSTVISGVGPVTTAVARSQDTKNRNLWLFFGTGRYFYRDATNVDDNDNRRALFGVQEPCYNTATSPGNILDGTCIASVSASDLENQTDRLATTTTALASGKKGWKIDLNIKTATEGAERVVTDTVALTNGTVFFTTFKPTMDICGYGGNSFLWGAKYDTGGAPSANALTGKALIQLSTGEFREVDLQTALQAEGGRKMASPMTGKPPSDAPPIVSTSQNKPLKKILHIQEH